jgi:hypothetical protein
MEPDKEIDARLAKSLAEHARGESYGPFERHEEMIEFLRREASRVPNPE